jgi:pimeloyl-ACP methyl ester carboxylesterase
MSAGNVATRLPVCLKPTWNRRGVVSWIRPSGEPPRRGEPAVSRAPDWLPRMLGRYDPDVWAEPDRRLRVALRAGEQGSWDVVLADTMATVAPSNGRPDATIATDPATWQRIATGTNQALAAYLAGRLSVRRNLHVGVGFLAATSGSTEAGRMRFRNVATRNGRLSTVEAGVGPPVLAVHGLGATKGSFVPTVAALSDRFRVIAFDLPGFGDSDKPIGAAYDARFFASACIDLLDALELDRVHVIGNSLGGRVTLELGLREPARVQRLALLACSLAWRRARPWAPLVRLTRPELGLVHLAPRGAVDGIVRRLIPGANDGWAAAGVDEFLRAYLTPSGRAAFYAAARHIYLDEPHGLDGFWPRLERLEPDALFIWGRQDKLVPLGFKRHVADALPRARHLELDCGHVPQIERPGPTNDAIAAFFSGAGVVARPDSNPSGSKRAAA